MANQQNTQQDATSWPDLAIGLYDRLTGRGAEISYQMDNLEVQVPSAVGSSQSARWVLNGSVRITTKDRETA